MNADDAERPAWRPRAGVEIARLRDRMLGDARRFFADRGILLVDTPAISGQAVSDPHIESVGVRLGVYPDRDVYLHTSPEYCMKRLLAAGFPDIGQICRVFRDGEIGRRHQPEFTMIEWYRLGFGLEDIMQDAEDLIAALLERSGFDESPSRISYRDAFLRHAHIDPSEADPAVFADMLDADDALRACVGDDLDSWLDLVMATRVAPRFDRARLTTVFHYPRSQAALARYCPSDPRVADRFEVFHGGLELANGYVELTDATEQERRFAADQERRKKQRSRIRPLDTGLIACLQDGLPDCAGVAIGFDRLLMINAGVDDLRDVQHFPHGTST